MRSERLKGEGEGRRTQIVERHGTHAAVGMLWERDRFVERLMEQRGTDDFIMSELRDWLHNYQHHARSCVVEQSHRLSLISASPPLLCLPIALHFICSG